MNKQYWLQCTWPQQHRKSKWWSWELLWEALVYFIGPISRHVRDFHFVKNILEVSTQPSFFLFPWNQISFGFHLSHYYYFFFTVKHFDYYTFWDPILFPFLKTFNSYLIAFRQTLGGIQELSLFLWEQFTGSAPNLISVKATKHMENLCSVKKQQQQKVTQPFHFVPHWSIYRSCI